METPMVRVARLDHEQVYFGLVEKPLAEVKAGELVFGPPELAKQLPLGAAYVDRHCDLPSGAYRWEAGKAAFEPLPRAQRKSALEAPSLEQAFYDFLTNGPEGKSVRAWAEWFRKTMDGRTK